MKTYHIKRGKTMWLIWQGPGGAMRPLVHHATPVGIEQTPEGAMAIAQELHPGDTILSEEPATEGYYGEV